MAVAYPTRPAAAGDVWPTSGDLVQWMRSSSVEASADEVVELAFNTADQLLRDKIDAGTLCLKAARAGIEIDPDADDYDEAVLQAWCPQYVFTAILIRAAFIYTRRESTNGTISFGEFATRVAAMDPTVEELLAPVRSFGIA